MQGPTRIKSFSDARPGYTGPAKLLHWVVLGLLAVQFVVAWAMPHMKCDTQPDTLINPRFSFGVLILGLAVVRRDRVLQRMLPGS